VNNLRKARAQIAAALARQGLSNAATFRFDERGLVVTIATDKVLFDSGSASLTPEGKRILDAVAPTLADLPNRLSIDGHTNWLPISTPQFPSNWELSGDRASGVLRYLIAEHGIPGTRMTATGFADTRPLLPRATPGPGRQPPGGDRRPRPGGRLGRPRRGQHRQRGAVRDGEDEGSAGALRLVRART
jgi:chemotaxis protein MotB